MTYIVVTGSVAAGATTLAEVFVSEFDGVSFLEERIQETNPFFSRAYEDAGRWGFASQTHFLVASVERHRQLKAIIDGEPADRFIVEDRTPFEHTGAYVEALHRDGLLPDDEVELLRQLGADLSAFYETPALLVYREMTDGQLRERVELRGRPGEEAVSLERLRTIHQAFDDFVAAWTRSPVVRIPADVDVLSAEGRRDAIASIIAAFEPA